MRHAAVKYQKTRAIIGGGGSLLILCHFLFFQHTDGSFTLFDLGCVAVLVILLGFAVGVDPPDSLLVLVKTAKGVAEAWRTARATAEHRVPTKKAPGRKKRP